MTEKCFDSGIIQAFLDGELAADATESAARHISACDDCAMRVALAEEEAAFAFSALEQEFNTLVPTQRLWAKINNSIEREKKSFWKPIFAFLLRPSTAACASLIFIFAVVIALLSFKTDTPVNYVAENSLNKGIVANAPLNSNPPNIQSAPVLPQKEESEMAKVNSKDNRKEYGAIKTDFVKETRQPINTNTQPAHPIKDSIEQPNKSENVLGEESYLKTIATLSDTVNRRKDEVLSSSARFAFEKDLAVTDDAIKRMRAEVKQNPNNEAAKQILRASYQNKIDLLNAVAEKTELMASLK